MTYLGFVNMTVHSEKIEDADHKDVKSKNIVDSMVSDTSRVSDTEKKNFPWWILIVIGGVMYELR